MRAKALLLAPTALLLPVIALLLPTVVSLILAIFFIVLPFKDNPPFSKPVRKRERFQRLVACAILVVFGIVTNLGWTNWLIAHVLTVTP